MSAGRSRTSRSRQKNLPGLLTTASGSTARRSKGLRAWRRATCTSCPDIATFAILPWLSGNEATARLICNIYTPDGQPFLGDPRAVLDAHDRRKRNTWGSSTIPGRRWSSSSSSPTPMGSLIPPRPQDSASYFDVPTDMVATGLWRQMAETLSAFGIEAEAMHHEVATGQHEIDFRYANALKTADNAVTFRVALKILAQQKGLYATFMPKPIRGISGSGMHVHQSLSYKANGAQRAFAIPGDPARPLANRQAFHRRTARSCAGDVRGPRAPCEFLQAARAGYEAPVHISWGRINRSALIRDTPGTHAGIDAHRDPLPGPELQSVPGIRRHARRRDSTASSVNSRSPKQRKRTSTL